MNSFVTVAALSVLLFVCSVSGECIYFLRNAKNGVMRGCSN